LTIVNICSSCKAKIEIPSAARMERVLPNYWSSLSIYFCLMGLVSHMD
jgi:hypothetical protein